MCQISNPAFLDAKNSSEQIIEKHHSPTLPNPLRYFISEPEMSCSENVVRSNIMPVLFK